MSNRKSFEQIMQDWEMPIDKDDERYKDAAVQLLWVGFELGVMDNDSAVRMCRFLSSVNEFYRQQIKEQK